MRIFASMLCGLGALMFLGCGGAGSLDTVPISGVVTLDGEPVEGARVVFAPTGGDGMAAAGVTDHTGRYRLTTRDPNDGAMEGSYMVMISKTTAGPSAVADAVQPGMSPEEATEAAMEAFVASGKRDPEFTDELPVKYKNPATSGFTAEVARGGQTEFDFALTSS